MYDSHHHNAADVAPMTRSATTGENDVLAAAAILADHMLLEPAGNHRYVVAVVAA